MRIEVELNIFKLFLKKSADTGMIQGGVITSPIQKAKPMEISIITSPFGCLPPSGIGAVERVWYNLALVMAQIGHHVTFYCKRPKDRPMPDVKNIRIVYLKGYDRSGSLLKDICSDLVYSVKAIFMMQQCDALVLNTFWSPLICLFQKYKYQISIYNVARYPKQQFKYFKYIDRLACVSTAVGKALLIQSPRRTHQVKVIFNPVDVSAFAYRPVAHNGSAFSLCYTGRIHPEKGLDILVQSFAMLRKRYPDIRLSLVGAQTVNLGGGGCEYCDRLNKLAEGALINWVDPISDASQLASEIAKCDIYCYPSVAEYGETFGVAPLEAMAVGRATIVSSLECFTDFVEDGVTGLVFDHQSVDPVEQLASKIEYLITHPDAREAIARAGSRVAHDRFRTERIAQEYLDDFESLLREKHNAKSLS